MIGVQMWGGSSLEKYIRKSTGEEMGQGKGQMKKEKPRIPEHHTLNMSCLDKHALLKNTERGC